MWGGAVGVSSTPEVPKEIKIKIINLLNNKIQPMFVLWYSCEMWCLGIGRLAQVSNNCDKDPALSSTHFPTTHPYVRLLCVLTS
uniref:Uncharacterized protein n=1 Tax=Romanomermis culicivorax TaxID=13658 RepID=A0A915HHF8_ROMCU